ncbi:MAG: IS21-like element helper ATPase IstB [Bacteroidota bacterium]|jgi:DNA replication protein DnaC
MNYQKTLELMRSLRLIGMADRYNAIMETPIHQRPDAVVILAQLVEAEELYRNNRRMLSAIKNARFRYQASLNDVIYSDQRNITREIITSLADCSFVDRGENIIITGATGCGKSYLASALGYQACTKGKRVAYFSLPKLLSKLKSDKLDGSFRKEMDRIENKNLLILDDWGLTPLDTAARLALLQIIEDRHSRYSTIITSQLPISAWHQYINENTVADAILDRIIHQAHRIELKGESLRKTTKIYAG